MLSNSSRRPLPGTVVAITGAARGIGLATARRLVAGGARVAIGDLDPGAVASAAASLGGSAVGVELDVRDEASFAAFLHHAEEQLGPVDVLINNAGVMPVGPLLQEDPATAALMFDVNVLGMLTGTKLVLPEMLGRGAGQIVNVASYAGRLPVPGQATYAGSKAAVLAITEGARWEFRGTGVTFTTIVPSFTRTELIAGTKDVRSAAPVTPEDVADAIVRSLRTGAAEVYVPRRVRPIGAAVGVLPRPLRYAVHRALGTDRVFLDIDRAGRRAYDARVHRDTAR